MKNLVLYVLLMVTLLSCETKTPIVAGEVVNMPSLPSLISCLDATVLRKFGTVGTIDTIYYGTSSEVFGHLISTDTVSLNGNEAVMKFHRRVFTDFAEPGMCDKTWYAFLDSLIINVRGKNRIVDLRDNGCGDGPLAKFVVKAYDLNQDGFLDFSFYNEGIAFGRNSFADYYLFDPKQEAYVCSEQLSNLANTTIDEKGLLHTYFWSGGERTASTIRIERNGILTKLNTTIEDFPGY